MSLDWEDLGLFKGERNFFAQMTIHTLRAAVPGGWSVGERHCAA